MTTLLLAAATATTKFVVVVIIVNNIDELPIIEYTQWQWFNGDDVFSHLNSTTNQKDYPPDENIDNDDDEQR